MLLVSCIPFSGFAQEFDVIDPVVVSTPVKEEKPARVTSVYGVTADDYLPTMETARQELRPSVRRSSSRPSFDLPDSFYFIGGPVFLLIFLRVLVLFLNGFEEAREDERREAANQKINP